ncbi:hypothetical protein DPMN_166777 [Dreissena polymorpha]|uniref:Uncharacterized protein n=1 Tax=Dreissena polymorpha TaxID=45954 RepID=A0A9D4IVS2_DREPO|nr:hypothetical protein DPMN_166777 [Dreissena polymorpha]
MEVESHSLSRSEVLSHAEAIRGATPSQRAKLSEHIASSKEDKSAKKNKVSNQETLVQAEPDKQENKDVSDGSELVVNDSVFAENNPDVSNEQTKQTKEEVDQTPYLSQKMLEVHTKLLKDAWLQLVDEDIEDPDLQKVRRDEKRKLKKELEFKKHNQLKPIEAEILNRLEMDGLGERPKSAQKPFARRKHIRRRIMQRSSDFIYQKSKAESYGEKFEKKQKYKLSTAKTDGLGRIRKSQSTDDLRSEYISDSLLKGFETERVRLRNERKRRFDESDELTEEERAEHEKYLRETQKYFTRATRDRYKETKHISDIHDEFELLNRVNVRETNTNLQNPQSILRKSKPQMRNTEREDEYMMDMDYLVKEQNKQANRDHSPIDKVDNNQGSLNKSYNKSDRSFNLRRERFLNLTDVSSRSYKKNPDTNANQENNKTKRENNGPLEYIKDKQEAHIDHIDNREMNATQEDHRRSKNLIQEERNLGDANKTTKAQKASVQRAHSERIVQYKYPDASDLYYGKHSHETGRPGETGMMLQNKPASPLGYQYAEYVDPKYQQYSKYLSEKPQQYKYQRNPYPAHLSQQNTQTQYSTYQLKKSTNPVQHYQIDAVVQLPSSISNANKYRQDNENHYNDVNQQKEILGNVRDRNKQDKKLEVTVNDENPPAEMNKEANEDRVEESYPQQPDINDNAQSKTTASTPNEMNNVANPKTKSADAEDAINVNADFIEQSLQEEELLYKEKSQEADASAPKSFSPTNLATEDEKDKDGLNHLDETITHPDYVRTDEVSEGDNSSFKEVDIPLNAAVRDVSTPKTFATADDIVKNANAVVSTTNNKKRHMVMVKKKYKTYTMPNIGLDRHERPYVEQPVLLRNRQFKKMPIDRVHPDTIIALDLYSDDNKASDKKVTFEDKLRHPNKINKYALDKIRKPKQNAYGNEFSVRDNIKLEIDIVEKKLPKIDGEKMETEKKKIKRFWEVVGGKDVNNERDIYGENGKPTTNKVLVTKVTKQRVLSAKSKASHKTQATSVKQHNVGKYNVTVEVAN